MSYIVKLAFPTLFKFSKSREGIYKYFLVIKQVQMIILFTELLIIVRFDWFVVAFKFNFSIVNISEDILQSRLIESMKECFCKDWAKEDETNDLKIIIKDEKK